ncbi:hypothetical protein AWM70_16200 [Paenibacillus yonginensis]|uniref:PAS domain-containing protein n=1 Tax=Paenibacillus yonginensis TaxID=1462996 RepID=A0A1B1N3F4_9BACL|nr:hypothetical protein AWM70_16200 [Paenibacillus yonginensis]
MDERLDSTAGGHLSLDQNLRVCAVDDSFCRLFEYKEKGVIGVHFESLLTRASRVFFQMYFLPLIRLNHHVDRMNLKVKTGNGGTSSVLFHADLRNCGEEWIYDCSLIPIAGVNEHG